MLQKLKLRLMFKYKNRDESSFSFISIPVFFATEVCYDAKHWIWELLIEYGVRILCCIELALPSAISKRELAKESLLKGANDIIVNL